MTPGNIAGMAALKGLNMVALTDHNTCANCPAFFSQCKKNGLFPVAGMELTTAEDIHIICLFQTLNAAMTFSGEVKKHIIPVKNRPDIFGEQRIIDEDDEITGYEDTLLINATDLEAGSAISLVRSYGGTCYPAHIDREANGMIAILGGIPAEYGFSCVEFNDSANRNGYFQQYALSGKKTLVNSDAHYLWDINEAENFLTLENEEQLWEYVK